MAPIQSLDESTLSYLREEVFDKYPLLIFPNQTDVSPELFLRFAQGFDPDCDHAALENPDNYPEQMLQPFDQFPDCKHVAPRGNVELQNYHKIQHIKVTPQEPFVHQYVWHTDLLGHEYKVPGVITAFYIVEQPLVGGDTDFISGETIYEQLSEKEQMACRNMLIEVNRKKFITKQIQTDYTGSNRIEPYEEWAEENVQIPLVFVNVATHIQKDDSAKRGVHRNMDEITTKPSILLLPTFFERVVGWSVKESRIWMEKFMSEKVLPHRVSLQWKKNDLAIFNNRKFIHSSTPARNYMDNIQNPRRLLLQTFVPTKRPLLAIRPDPKNSRACYDSQWIHDQKQSIRSTNDYVKYVKQMQKKYPTISCDEKYYIVAGKNKSKDI
jgi:alpha-ketoglutarate-dependent taurine dioxygenase